MASTILNPFISKAPAGSYSSFAAPSYGRKATRIHCSKGKEPLNGAVDRRELLLGLGGLYSATLALNREALASPVITPDIADCHNADLPNAYDNKCCPPLTDLKIADYKIPTFTKLRERRPAHELTPKQINDYETAISSSKKLGDLDPWSFIQQAKIHCAYCNGGYDQVGFPDLELQVHSSWLFLPFHRWYLYFYERILGKLCNNENFALPYWNWDNPPGMTMPQIFINPNSPLYNVNRDQSHLPPVIVDLDNADNENFTPEEQLNHNLWVMYRTMIAGAKGPSCFFGGKYVGGTKPNPGAGTVELPHNLVHRWTGNPGNPNGEDMGAFYSAGRDPIFYCHHSNVDRMWSLWKNIGGDNRRDITEPDFLNTSFLFYDENAQLVRVYVRDSLETETLGYKYQKTDLPWLNRRPKPRKLLTKKPKSKPAEEAKFPLVLKSPVKTTLKVPAKTNPDDENVIVTRVSLDRTVYAKFDVYVNAEDTESLGVGPPEKAGSFVNIPQIPRPTQPTLRTYLKLEISELLKDIGADADEEILVTIVPRKGRNKVTIESVKLQTTCDVAA